ncbi:MAG: hypothetical protein AABZ47_16215 [Planctomycetota bacterium]
MNQSEHEASLINAFIVPQKRGRILSLLRNPKRRQTVLDEIYHFRDLDERFVVALPSHNRTPEGIAEALRRYGAPDLCWVISTNSSLDGREMLLDEALAAIVGCDHGNLVSCVAGKLAFFEGECESPNNRFVLRRNT